MKPTIFIAWLALAPAIQPVCAEPYLPARDDDVLERLPDRASEAKLGPLRTALAQNPGDITLALQLAREHIEQSRRSGDPRPLGRAEAILAPWSSRPTPPVPVLVMRAILRQANHEFDAALRDLDRAIQLDPGNAQAWLTRASLFRLRGDYPRAESDCRRLVRLRQGFVAQVCLAETAALSGRAEAAYRLLNRLAIQIPSGEPDARYWLEGLLADIAERRGDAQAAESHYRAAIATGKADMVLLTAYADYLLDQGRPREALTLLLPHRGADSALLRLALAAQTADDPRSAADIDELRLRFAAGRQRGAIAHLREEALFTLSLLDDPAAALPLAVANWAVQHEPADARILLAAALAAGQPEAARPVLDWLKSTGLEDARLQALLQALQG